MRFIDSQSYLAPLDFHSGFSANCRLFHAVEFAGVPRRGRQDHERRRPCEHDAECNGFQSCHKSPPSDGPNLVTVVLIYNNSVRVHCETVGDPGYLAFAFKSCSRWIDICLRSSLKALKTAHQKAPAPPKLLGWGGLEPGGSDRFPSACFCVIPNSWRSLLVLSKKKDVADP